MLNKKEILKNINYFSYEEKMDELRKKDLDYKVRYNYPFLTLEEIASLCNENEEEILEGIKEHKLTGIEMGDDDYTFVADEVITVLDLNLKDSD